MAAAALHPGATLNLGGASAAAVSTDPVSAPTRTIGSVMFMKGLRPLIAAMTGVGKPHHGPVQVGITATRFIMPRHRCAHLQQTSEVRATPSGTSFRSL
jgi:hypothetical protein